VTLKGPLKIFKKGNCGFWRSMKQNSNLETIMNTATVAEKPVEVSTVKPKANFRFREIKTDHKRSEMEKGIESHISGRLKIGRNMANEYLFMKQSGNLEEAEEFRHNYMFGGSLRNYFETSRVSFRHRVRESEKNIDKTYEVIQKEPALGYQSGSLSVEERLYALGYTHGSLP